MSPLATAAATDLFDALGASATRRRSRSTGTGATPARSPSHNPVAFKARIIGDAAVNDTEPPYEWSIGVPKRSTA